MSASTYLECAVFNLGSAAVSAAKAEWMTDRELSQDEAAAAKDSLAFALEQIEKAQASLDRMLSQQHDKTIATDPVLEAEVMAESE